MKQFYLAAFAAIAGVGFAHAEDKCLPILLYSAHDTISIDTKTSTQQSLKVWFCDERFLTYKTNQEENYSATIPIEGVPFTFGANSTDQRALDARSKFCKSDELQFDQKTQYTLLKSTVVPKALDKFVECQKNQKGDIELLALSIKSQSGRQSVLNLRWDRIHPSQPLPVIDTILTSNLTCSKSFKKGTIVTEKDGIVSQCARQTDGPSEITISTKYDSTSLHLPPIGKAGVCSTKIRKKIETLSNSGCRQGGIICPQLHDQPEQIYSTTISASSDNYLLTTDICNQLCSPHKDKKNGCGFSRIVSITRIDPRTVQIFAACGSHPHDLVYGLTEQQKNVSYEDQTSGLPFDVFYSSMFSVEVPTNGNRSSVECLIGSSMLKFDPAESNSIVAPIKLVHTSSLPDKTIYHLSVDAK